ncbi:hypothetical protein HYC85_013744 [Camellia sinensis]|uniref:Tetratricopeptide repeat protein n=1 Tax=Camellia sinensis TaxID=4442 RepID=A0A7J7H5E4_CAMSI|nr:hypothetical protein HYC85_013744 [Camellia sinensis]
MFLLISFINLLKRLLLFLVTVAFLTHQPKGEITFLIEGKANCVVEAPSESQLENELRELISRGQCLSSVKLEGDIDQGVEYYKKALYYNWHYADAMYNLGVAYGEMLKFDMGKMDAAGSMIEKAIVANPTYAEAYNNLGLHFTNLNWLFYVVFIFG